MSAICTRFAITLLAAAIAAPGTAAFAQQPVVPPASSAPQAVRPADLLTAQERQTFRSQMEAAKTAEERRKVREAHRAMLEQRAKERGVTLAAPEDGRGRGDRHGAGHGPRGDGPMGQLFTQAERDQMRERMHAAQTADERQRIRDEYRTLAEQRAKEKGITLPPRGQGPGNGPRAGGRGGAGPYAELFTQAERDEHRARLQGAQTTEERMKVRDEIRAQAEVRAKEKGITLPPAGQGPRGGPRQGPGSQPAPSAPQS